MNVGADGLRDVYKDKRQFLLSLFTAEMIPVCLALPFAIVYFMEAVPFAAQHWWDYTKSAIALLIVTRIPDFFVVTRVIAVPALEWIQARQQHRRLGQAELSRLYTQLTWLVPKMQVWAASLWAFSALGFIVYARLRLLQGWLGMATLVFSALIAVTLSLSFSYFTFTWKLRPMVEDAGRLLQVRPKEGVFRISLRLKIGGSIFALIFMAFLSFGVLMTVKVRTLFESYSLAVNEQDGTQLAAQLAIPGKEADTEPLLASYSNTSRVFILTKSDGAKASEVNGAFWGQDIQAAVLNAPKEMKDVTQLSTERTPLKIFRVPGRALYLVMIPHPDIVQKGVNSLLVRTAFFLAAILLLMALYVMALTREVMRMVRAAARYNRRLSEGDLSELPYAFSDDELGEMADDLRVTFRGLARLAREMRTASEVLEAEAARLTSTSRELVTSMSEQTGLAEETTRFAKETQHSMALVSESMSQVAGATQDVSATILEMKASVEEIAGTAEVLGGSVETSVTSTNELAAVAEQVRAATGQLKQSGEEAVSFLSELGTSLGETQGNSEALSRLAHRVTTLAEGGSGNVSAVEQEVLKSLKGFEESHRALAELRAAMDSIGRILDVIQDITEQTNLLSLNASIIAAGAGEHGKAFGVVATQIRELSAKTKLRAAEIRDVVRSIQRGGEQISGAMEHVYRTVSRSSELSRDADISLRAILEAASEQEDMTQRIAAASEELAHGGISASRTMQQIFSMIEGIGRSVQEQAGSTRLLTVEAEKVRDGVLHLRRATEEQARGAQVISEATTSITRDSQDTSGTVHIQAERSRATVKAMQDLTDRAVAIQRAFESLAEAAVRLERSATALDLEVRKFKVPEN